MELEDAVAVVTGAARGIGRAIAEAYARRGARVALVDVLGELVRQTAGELGSAGGQVLPVAADITSPEQVEAMAATVRSQLGMPSILVNNAGSLTALGPVWEVDATRWARDVTVNLIGTFLVTRAFLGDMIGRKGGYVISLVGAGVDKPHLYTTGYDSSKAGVVRLMEAVAKEAGEFGVKAFTLCPGTVWTPMTQFIAESPEGRKWRPTFGDIFARGDGLSAELAANFCVQLVSGRADALTGRWLHARSDFDELVGNADAFCADNLNVLRLRQ